MGTTTAPGPTLRTRPPPGPPPTSPPRWTTGRVLAVVAAVLLFLGGLGLSAVGTAAVFADQALRTGGWVQVAQDDVTSTGYAAVTGDLVVDAGGGRRVAKAVVGDLRVRVSPGSGSGPVFAGIARTSDVEDYLGGTTSSCVAR